MQEALVEVLRRRKDRAMAVILSVSERTFYQHLPKEAQRAHRKVVLDALNDYHEMVVDIMGSLDTGQAVLNEDYLDKIDALYDAVVVPKERIPLDPRRQGG